MTARGELAVAVALDALVGEPPVAVHPVVWMGRLADVFERRLRPPGARGEVAAGGAAWAGGLAVVVGAGIAASRAPWPVRGALLWSLFAGRMLFDEVAAVEHALTTDGLEAGRRRVGRIVSRPTSQLDEAEVRMAAIESLAENLSDSLVAPLWWWALGGLPAAAAYRWIDTLDSRWGYRSAEWDRRGRVAARADDAANLLPARLTALLLRGRLDRAVRREASRTASPNAGWPMAAMALRLDARLAKRGSYVLHPDGRDPDPATVRRALRTAAPVAVGAVVMTWLTADWRRRMRDLTAAARGPAVARRSG